MSSNRDFDREVTFEIVEEIGVIATHSTGWKKELNLVSWNGGQAKYDIREDVYKRQDQGQSSLDPAGSRWGILFAGAEDFDGAY